MASPDPLPATVEREPLHDEMGRLQLISHAPLFLAATTATVLLVVQCVALCKQDRPGRRPYLELAALAVCVLLFYAALGTSLAMHHDMGDNGHVEYHLGKAEYAAVGVAIPSFLLLVAYKYAYSQAWEVGSLEKPRWGLLCRALMGLFLASAALAAVHFFVGNAHWRDHKRTDAHRNEQLSGAFEVYNLWHMQFHVYAGYAALFIVLLYGALRQTDVTPSATTP